MQIVPMRELKNTVEIEHGEPAPSPGIAARKDG